MEEQEHLGRTLKVDVLEGMKYTLTTTHIILYNPKVDHRGYEVVNVTIICVTFILHFTEHLTSLWMPTLP